MSQNNPKSKNTIPLPDYKEGTLVKITINGQDVRGTFSHYAKDNEALIKTDDGKALWRKANRFWVLTESDQTTNILTTEEIQMAPGVEQANAAPVKIFDINKRFDFLSSLTRMVINGQQPSLLVTGDGGLGKTYTVMEEFTKKGLVEGTDYIVIKGYSTPKGLYNLLYTNCDEIIVFDDCDSILINDTAINILKGALDSMDKRVISWISSIPLEDVPNQFEFTGQVIFISNMKRTRVPQPIISRATSIDVSMSENEKIERMRKILPRVKPNLDMGLKEECLNILNKYKNDAKDLNVRTLLKVITIRTSGEENWEEMAEYMVLS